MFGRGKVEDFTWKGMLDFATCTECGRCQSQCPAWNTGKPLSPKLVIMDLRDHLFAKAPYLLGRQRGRDCPRPRTGRRGQGRDRDRRGRPGVASTALPTAAYRSPASAGSPPRAPRRPTARWSARRGGRRHRPDVLWSCTTCGACVEQCPVDIEHVDHIVDMRRYQVLIESAFPSEAGVMLRNLENKGNPWG